MSSNAESTPPSGSGAKPVGRAALVTHGRPGQIGDGIERILEVAGRAGVELIVAADEAARHGLEATGDPRPQTSSSCSAATGRCSARCGRTSAPASP